MSTSVLIRGLFSGAHRPRHAKNSLLRQRLMLYGLAVALATIEAIGLYVAGFGSALPLASQASAPVPFGAYHDLRWVFAYSTSWWTVAGYLIALLIVRSALNMALAMLAWPEDRTPPVLRALAIRSVIVTAVTVVVLSPWATLAFASDAVSYSWFMLGSIVAAGATAIVLPSALLAEEDWWRRIMPWRAIGFAAAAWVAVSLEATAITFSPGWVKVVTAAGGGALNALLWQYQVVTLAHAERPKHTVPVAPALTAGVLAVFLVGGGILLGSANSSPSSNATGSSGTATGSQPGTQESAATVPAGTPIMYVAGYTSSYDGSPYHLFRQRVWRFSYRGLTGNGQPAAYDPVATHQSLATSEKLLAQQIQVYHQQAGKPIVLIADSEGTLVVRRYLEEHANPPVRLFVETSPLVRPARVYFPNAGNTGFGFLGGWEARGMLQLVGAESSGFQKRADQPFVRSVVDNAAALRGDTMCPAGNVKVVAFVPFEGALTVYGRPISHVPWTAEPAYHANLLGDATVQRDVAQVIRTGQLPGHAKSTGAFRVISAAASAWQVPAVPLQWINGSAAPNSDPAFGDWTCAAPSPSS